MTATTDSPSNIPVTSLGFSGDDTQLLHQRGPWSQIVRRDQSCAPAERPSSPTICDSDGSPPNRASEKSRWPVVVGKPMEEAGDGMESVKKQVWNKPSGGTGSPVEVAPVMGAASWPALLESTMTPVKSGDSPRPSGDGTTVSPSVVIPQSPQKSSQNSTTKIQNHAFSNRQKSMIRRNANNANDGKDSEAEKLSAVGKHHHPEQVQKDYPQKSNWESGSRGVSSQGFGGKDHTRNNNSFRRGNGPQHRAANLHNNNRVNKGYASHHDRGDYEWNSGRGGGRDFHQRRVGPPNFIRQPANLPFVNLSQACATPILYPEFAPQVYYVATSHTETVPCMQFTAHTQVPPLVLPAPDPHVSILLVKQIEYYFSGENLCRDLYLRRNMDKQGWVPISLIATFNRVKNLTDSIPFILDSIRMSSSLEVQGNKIRRRNDWNNWLLPPQSSASNIGSPVISNVDHLTASMRGFGLEGYAQKTIPIRFPYGETQCKTLNRSNSSEEFSGAAFASDKEAKGQVVPHPLITNSAQ